MYCVQCGVELADGEKKCPLCGTEVCLPQAVQKKATPLYPPDEAPTEVVSRSGLLLLLTVLFLLPLVICLLCDLRINGGVYWSGYVSGALLMFYVFVVLPLWFRKPNPVVFVLLDFTAATFYLMYINGAVGGHWFLRFALPVMAWLAFIVTGVLVLLRRLRQGHLYVFGGALIAVGAFMVVVEYLLNQTFHTHSALFWSIYPLASGILLGMLLLVIARNRPLREALHKKFFL